MKYFSLKKDLNILIDEKVNDFYNPDYIYLPFKNRILKRENDFVLKYENVVDDSKTLSSISGKVIGLKNCHVNGIKQKCVVIENDFKEEKGIENKVSNKLTKEIIIDKLEENCENNLLEIFKCLLKVDNVVVNVVEDEPYVKNKIVTFKENISEVLEIIDKLSVLYGSKNNTIVVKSSDSNVVDECLNIIGSYPNIDITLADDLFLLGRKQFLLSYLKYDLNSTLYLDINDLIKFYNIVKLGKRSTYLYLTISGDAIEKSKVIKVKKYTNLEEIIRKYIKVIEDDYALIVNGCLGGYEINNLDLIITEDIFAINIMKRNNIKEEKCINCGSCVEVCPVKINPVLYINSNIKDKKCIGCGLCSYICPSYINIKKKVAGK